MKRRLRVLMSAYACEPGKGSEPEVGWRWMIEMSKYHDVIVLTRSNNQPVIEAYLKGRPDLRSNIKFMYHDLSNLFIKAKKISNVFNWYYIAWQYTAKSIIKAYIKREDIELVHLVTFASFRYPVFLGSMPVPVIWGPVGGGEQAPWSLLFHKIRFPSTAKEIIRNLATYVSILFVRRIDPTHTSGGIALASTPQTQRILEARKIKCEQVPTIGIDDENDAYSQIDERAPLKCIYVGRLVLLKGVHLLLEAFSKMNAQDATLTLVGDGDLRKWLESLADDYGISDRVTFVGQVPKEDIDGYYRDHDVLVAPSLYESGGYMVLEAFMQRRPAIVLDVGGPALSVDQSCGIKVPVGSGHEVVTSLAEAMDYYASNKGVIDEHGVAGYKKMRACYSWEKKGGQMDAVYRQATRGLKENV